MVQGAVYLWASSYGIFFTCAKLVARHTHPHTLCVRLWVPKAVGDKPQFAALKLHIEFDETQQDQIIHYGIIRNKAALPVLAARMHLNQCASRLLADSCPRCSA